MKKILLLLLLLIPASLFAQVYNWDANVVAMYDFEQNGDDDLGTYNLVTYGTATYNNADVKLGAYKLSITSWNNTWRFPASLINAIAALSSFTVETWYYQPGAGNIWRIVFLGGKTAYWYDDANSFGVAIRNDMGVHWFGFNGATQITGVPATGWHHMSLQWTANTAKYYLDGNLISTRATQTVNPFSQIIQLWLLQGTNSGVQTNFGTFLDKLIVSNVARNGVETNPLLESPTNTPSPTDTASPTPTMTPIFVSAITGSSSTITLGQNFTLWINNYLKGYSSHIYTNVYFYSLVNPISSVPTPVATAGCPSCMWSINEFTNQNGEYYYDATITVQSVMPGSSYILNTFRDAGAGTDYNSQWNFDVITETFTPTMTPTFTATPTSTLTITPTMQPHFVSTMVSGFRVERTGKDLIVIYKNVNTSQFFIWNAIYATWEQYPIIKPDSVTITPLY